MLPLQFLEGLPAFLAYLGVSVLLLLVFVLVYVRVTAHDEFALIRQNNVAAAVAFGAAIIGFCLPLHSAVSHSVSLLDCAVWGAVALLVQVFAYFGVRVFIRDLSTRIDRGELAPALFAASAAIGVGLLNAAAMTY
jgi:putative membrane protein